ncbi:unnamed protein product [Bemisia tabaci]|uniref:C-type lectin domain-containing protein n=1 Tax=Bemisia tabaci TaxID=7038 RepID=A0A9P0AJM5_BEMTA|nr:unnamed protein product [Bemisia tabaci]
MGRQRVRLCISGGSVSSLACPPLRREPRLELLTMISTSSRPLSIDNDPEVGSIVKGIEDRVYICPPKFVRQGNSCYYISTDNATWHDAHFKCQSMSKKKKITLAVLETKKEDRNLKQFLKSPQQFYLENSNESTMMRHNDTYIRTEDI